MRSEIDGYILTGGNSSRMGTPKGRLTLGGSTFVELIAAELGEISHTLFTVGDSDVYPPLENVPDMQSPAAGTRSSIAGLMTALSHARTEWIFVVACDLPFVTSELFGVVADARSADMGAVVPMDCRGFPQPVCALYRPAACIEECAASIGHGDLSLTRLLPRISAFLLPFESVGALEGAGRFFRNINTPEDLADARALADTD